MHDKKMNGLKKMKITYPTPSAFRSKTAALSPKTWLGHGDNQIPIEVVHFHQQHHHVSHSYPSHKIYHSNYYSSSFFFTYLFFLFYPTNQLKLQLFIFIFLMVYQTRDKNQFIHIKYQKKNNKTIYSFINTKSQWTELSTRTT